MILEVHTQVCVRVESVFLTPIMSEFLNLILNLLRHQIFRFVGDQIELYKRVCQRDQSKSMNISYLGCS